MFWFLNLAFFKFACVGVINTALHFFVLTALVSFLGWTHPPANAGAFLCANIFSYFANSIWSFGAGVAFRRYLKFLVTSLVGVIISWGIMGFGDANGWDYRVTFCLQVALMPFVNFSLMRFFVFPAKENAD